MDCNIWFIIMSDILPIIITMTVSYAVGLANMKCFPPPAPLNPKEPAVALLCYGFICQILTFLLNRFRPSASLACNWSVSVTVTVVFQSLVFFPHPTSLFLRFAVALLNAVIVGAAFFGSVSLAAHYRKRERDAYRKRQRDYARRIANYYNQPFQAN